MSDKSAVNLDGEYRVFADTYLANGFNGTQAALSTWPSLTYGSARDKAYRMLTNADIKTYLEERFKQQVMSADEALARIRSIATGDMGDFLEWAEDEDGNLSAWLSLDKAKELSMTHLIREIKQARVTTGKDDDRRTETTIWVKLHDAHKALEDILKMHGKFGAKGTEDDPQHHELTITRRIINGSAE